MRRPAYPQWRRIGTPIALAALSLAAAIVIWIAVTEAENPTRVDVFRGAIAVRAVNVPEDLAVASIREPSVSLRVSATEAVFARLTTEDFRAEVDLSGVRQPTSGQVVLSRVLTGEDVKIVGVSPSFVTVVLEPVTPKLIPVQPNVVGAPPQGYSVGAVEANPATVRVSGAASLVNLVASAGADINLTGLRASLEQRAVLTPRDARGADIRGLAVDPGSADIRITVTQQEVTLALTIVPVVQGSVADGFNLIGLSSDPPAVAVSGPLELLQAHAFLNTDTIDVTGLSDDATRDVRLRLPAGLRATRENVTVRLKVVPAPGEITLLVAPQASDLGENLKATFQTASVSVRLSGDLPLLRDLQPGAVQAIVSAAGLSEGVHVLAVEIVAPDGVQVVSKDPAQVVLVLGR